MMTAARSQEAAATMAVTLTYQDWKEGIIKDTYTQCTLIFIVSWAGTVPISGDLKLKLKKKSTTGNNTSTFSGC